MNENNNQNEMNTQAETPRVTARITWMNSETDASTDARKAMATITIADCFRVRGLAIFEGKNGLFVSMPVRSKEVNGEKRYVDVAHPVTHDMWKAIQDSVLDAYAQSLAISQQYKAERQHVKADSSEAQINDTPISGDETMDSLPFSVDESAPDEEDVPILGLMM